MNPDSSPILELTDASVDRLLRNAMRNTLLIGVAASIAILIGSNWRNAAMLLTGTLVSAVSILEWKRLVHVLRSALDQQKVPRGAAAVVLFFVLRLTIYGGVIYGSLKCFQGSTVALLSGLGLAAFAIGWEAIRILLT